MESLPQDMLDYVIETLARTTTCTLESTLSARLVSKRFNQAFQSRFVRAALRDSYSIYWRRDVMLGYLPKLAAFDLWPGLLFLRRQLISKFGEHNHAFTPGAGLLVMGRLETFLIRVLRAGGTTKRLWKASFYLESDDSLDDDDDDDSEYVYESEESIDSMEYFEQESWEWDDGRQCLDLAFEIRVDEEPQMNMNKLHVLCESLSYFSDPDLARYFAEGYLVSYQALFEKVRAFASENPHLLHERDFRGRTPLLVLWEQPFLFDSEAQFPICSRFLLMATVHFARFGADVNAADNQGRTLCTLMASRLCHFTRGTQMDLYQFLKVMIPLGVQGFPKDVSGRSMFTYEPAMMLKDLDDAIYAMEDLETFYFRANEPHWNAMYASWKSALGSSTDEFGRTIEDFLEEYKGCEEIFNPKKPLDSQICPELFNKHAMARLSKAAGVDISAEMEKNIRDIAEEVVWELITTLEACAINISSRDGGYRFDDNFLLKYSALESVNLFHRLN